MTKKVLKKYHVAVSAHNSWGERVIVEAESEDAAYDLAIHYGNDAAHKPLSYDYDMDCDITEVTSLEDMEGHTSFNEGFVLLREAQSGQELYEEDSCKRDDLFPQETGEEARDQEEHETLDDTYARLTDEEQDRLHAELFPDKASNFRPSISELGEAMALYGIKKAGLEGKGVRLSIAE